MQKKRHPHLLEPSHTALLVIDVQEKFRPVIQRFDQVVEACQRLVRTFRTLDLPICVTEQYPKGLGRTVPELLEFLGNAPVLEKTAFSSCGCPGVAEFFSRSASMGILVCGIEAHVCVNQTVHDLLQVGHRVHVATDAVESRRPVDRETAIRKMCSSGAILTTTEMAAFELLGDARHPRFKEVQALFK